MPAISLATRDQTMHQLIRRGNWASHNAGVVLVFCIVFIVAVGLASLFIYKKWAARKAAK
jgi:ATPase proteolipid family protein